MCLQIGSSAMPYKRNPMKCERCCGMANVLMSGTQTAYRTLAAQRLERSLDDSSSRRILLPDSMLLTDALLSTMQNIFEGLSVQTRNVARTVAEELPFLAMEKALMYLSEMKVNRQLAHEKIRQTAIAAKHHQHTTGNIANIADILSDTFFDSIRQRLVDECANPLAFVGRSESQTHEFIAHARDTIASYMPNDANVNVQMDV